jgi:hypothetical protein
MVFDVATVYIGQTDQAGCKMLQDVASYCICQTEQEILTSVISGPKTQPTPRQTLACKPAVATGSDHNTSAATAVEPCPVGHALLPLRSKEQDFRSVKTVRCLEMVAEDPQANGQC